VFERIGRAVAATTAVLAAAVLALWSPGDALAHAGHDHGEAAPSIRGELLPRATTHSDLFEIVVVAAEGQLIVFLDDYVGNTPVTGAELELLIDGDLGEPSEIAPGVYAFSWTPPAEATTFDLTAVVTAASGSDLLLASLELPPAVDEPMPAITVLGSFSVNLQTLLVLIAFLLGAAASYLLLQRQRLGVAEAAVAGPAPGSTPGSTPGPGAAGAAIDPLPTERTPEPRTTAGNV